MANQRVTDPGELAQLSAGGTDTPVSASDLKELADGVSQQSFATRAGDAVDNAIATAGMGVDSVIGPAMRKIGSQPEMQPFRGLFDPITEPFNVPPGTDPITRVAHSVRSILGLPFRAAVTMGVPGQIAQDKALDAMTNASVDAEKMGKDGIPAPLAAALAMGVGMALDPRTYIGAKGVDMEGIDGQMSGGMGQGRGPAAQAEAAKYGVDLNAAQATNSALLKRVDNLLNRDPYSSQNFEDFYRTQLQQADGIRQALMAKIGKGDSTASKIVNQQIKDSIGNYLQGASPEDAAVLQDKLGDLDAYLGKAQAGQFTKSVLAQTSKLAGDKASQLYDNLKADLPPQLQMKVAPFAEQAKKFLIDELQAPKPDRNGSWINRLTQYANLSPEIQAKVSNLDLSEATNPAATQELVKQIQDSLQQPPQIPFAGAQMTMKALRDLRIQNDPGYLLGASGQGNRFSGYAAQLRKTLAGDIESSMGGVSQQAAHALENNPHADPAINAELQKLSTASDRLKMANANYASYKQTFNDPFVKSLLKNDPEDFLNHAIQPQDITNVGKLKNILGPQGFQPLKENLLANMLVNKAGELSPTSFINKINKIGYPTLMQVFEPDELREIVSAQNVFQNIANVEKAAGGQSPTAGVLMTKNSLITRPSAAMTALLTGHPLVAAGIMASTLMPKLVAKAYLSAPVRDLLIHGIAAPHSALAALGIMGKTAMAMGLRSNPLNGQNQANGNGEGSNVNEGQ